MVGEDHGNAQSSETNGAPPRRSLLNLAPLELDCMNTLWPLGEGTVREIRDGLAVRRARAYTTIMTIMDRLARKGIVERRKSGRAYIYRPQLSAEEARRQAVGAVVEGFFGGSQDAAAEYLASSRRDDAASPAPLLPTVGRPTLALAAAAAASPRFEVVRPAAVPSREEEPVREDAAGIDETLL